MVVGVREQPLKDRWGEDWKIFSVILFHRLFRQILIFVHSFLTFCIRYAQYRKILEIVELPNPNIFFKAACGQIIFSVLLE